MCCTCVNACAGSVDAGYRGVIFDKLSGVSDIVKGEGTHFMIPFMQTPILFDIRSKPRSIPVMTPSKGLATSPPPHLPGSLTLFRCG